jgi:hypothetical protein
VQERNSVTGGQCRQDLRIGEARVVVDHHVDVLVARLPPLAASDPRAAVLTAAVADHAVACAALGDAPERLDVDVDELAGVAPLVAVGRLRRLEPGALAEPDPASTRARQSRAGSRAPR